MNQIEVFQIGTPVIIGDKIEGTIIGLSLREHYYLTYEISWWNGNERKTSWFEQIEIKRAESSTSIKIGFVK